MTVATEAPADIRAAEWAARIESDYPREYWAAAFSEREKWPRGQWDNEPDRIEWRWHGPGRFPLLIARSIATGALCGYVAVPKEHVLYGCDWQEIVGAFDVHGGLSWSAAPGNIIRHAGEPVDVWWLGFDCGHAWDVMPALCRFPAMRPLNDVIDWQYKNVPFVRSEVESLAAQIETRSAP